MDSKGKARHQSAGQQTTQGTSDGKGKKRHHSANQGKMGSKKVVSSLNDCLVWINQEQKNLSEAPFGNTFLTLREESERHKKKHTLITEFKGFMEKFRSDKYTEEEIGNMDTAYDALVTLSSERQKCLESLQKIVEIEDLFQKLSSEIDSRALQLTAKHQDGTPLTSNPKLAKTYQSCVKGVQKSWDWLNEVTYCLEIHESNAAGYHQFFHELKHHEDSLDQYTSDLTQQVKEFQAKQSKDIEHVIKKIRECIVRLLEFQNAVENLTQRSSQIVPLKLRKEMPSHPLKMKTLATYQHKDFCVKEGEEVTLVDNAHATKWKVRNAKGQEGSAPAILFLIPPPDGHVVDTARGLRYKLMSVWDHAVRTFRGQIMKLLTTIINEANSDEVSVLTSPQKQELMKLLRSALKKLHIDSPNSPDLQRFLAAIQGVAKLLKETKHDKESSSSAPTLFQECKPIDKMVTTYEELIIYGEQYSDIFDNSSQSKNYLIMDEEGKFRWCTNGYVQRMKHVEIETDIPIAIEHNEVQLMIIYEKGEDEEEPQNDVVDVSSNLETIQEEMFEESTVRETKKFVITGVVDPRNKETISIFAAVTAGIVDRANGVYRNPDTGESMTIPEAMNQGLIMVEFTDRSVIEDSFRRGVITTIKTVEGQSFHVAGVIDPQTNQRIDVHSAIKAGILDTKKGLYVNPQTGESMSIADAVDHGLVLLAENGEVPTDDDEFITTTYLILSVKDPKSKRDITLKKAVQNGIIDKEKGIYKDLTTGEEITLADAITRGLVKARPVDPNAKFSPDETVIVKHRKPVEEPKKILPEITDPTYLALKDDVDMSTLAGVYEAGPDGPGNEITLEEAVSHKIMALEALEYVTNNNEKCTLQEAVALGYVDPVTATRILRECEARSLDNCIQNGDLDPDTGLYTDPNTGDKILIRAAIENGYINPDKVFYFDIPENKVTSLGYAIRNGKFNKSTGRFIDPVTGDKLSITSATEKQLIDPRVDADTIMDRTNVLKHLQPYMDTSIMGVKHPVTGEDMSVKDAVLSGLLDIPEVAYISTDADESFGVGIPEAVNTGNINPDTAKEIFGALSKMSLGALMDKKMLDEEGNYVDPETKQKMSIEDAIEAGLIDPNYIFFVDKIGSEVVSLADAIDQGQFNPQTGKFVDPSGREISISIATKRDLVNPYINPDDFIEEKFTIQHMVDSGLANDDTIIKIPGRQDITLKEALESNLIGMGTLMNYDPKTGSLSVDDEETLKALMDMKDHLEWVANKEVELAKELPPSEDLEKLKAQADEHETLLKDVESHHAPIAALLEEAQQILENNKDTPRDEAALQQYQRLRFCTSDLRVRFEAVYGQAEARMKLLEALLQELEEFYSNLDNFDEWIAQGNNNIDLMNKALTDLENLQEHSEAFKQFADEAMMQEGVLEAITKSGNQFKSDAQDFASGQEAFRNGIQQEIELDTPDGSGQQIEQEMDTVSDKYKELLTNCMSLMAQLTETVEKSREFKEIQAELEDWLPETEEQIDKVKLDEIESEPAVIQKEIELLSVYNADVASQGKLLDDLKRVGGELVDFLEEGGASDKAQQIADIVSTMEERYNNMQDQYGQKNAVLNKMLVQSQDISHGIDIMLGWLQDTENRLKALPPVSLNKDILNTQLQEHRVLQGEINNRKANLETLTKQAEGVPGTEIKINEALERFENLNIAMKERGDDMDDIMSRMATIQKNVAQVENWISSAVNVLKKATQVGAVASREKIEELYQQKQQRQQDLDEIKKVGKELLDNPKTGHKNSLRELMADVQGKWHSLTDMLVQLISMEALQDIDEATKFLDKVETDINTADPVRIEPEALAVQLKDQKALHQELVQKKDKIKELVGKCNFMLRDTTSEEADNLKNKLEHIRHQSDAVCKLSEDRLHQLEEAKPLVGHFNETQSDLRVWLSDMENEIQGLDTPGNSPDQIKKQQEQVKNTQRLIEDHKPILDELNNTGKELVGMCGEEDAAQVQDTLFNINGRYDEIKAKIREKMNDLDDAFRQATSEVSDTLDGLSDEFLHLNDQLASADPVSARPEPIREQIVDAQNILEDLERRHDALNQAKEAAEVFIAQIPDEEKLVEADELKSKVNELEQLHDSIKADATVRARSLEEALNVGERFWDKYSGLMDTLRELQDNLNSQDAPQIEPAGVKEQKKELQAIKDEFQKTRTPVEECRHNANHFSALVGEPGKVEVKRAIEDMDENVENIEDGIKDREEELDTAFEKGKAFENTMQTIAAWLPKFEDKLDAMGPVAGDTRSIRIQIEELKVLKLQTHPRCVDIESLNSQAADLKQLSPLAADSVVDSVREVNERWNNLLMGIAGRETSLQDNLVKLGELDHALDDVVGFLTQAEQELTQLDDVNGDHKHIESNLRKLQLLQKDINLHEPLVAKLNKAVDEVASRNKGGAAALKEKQEEMNELWKAVNIGALDKQNQLQDLLKAAKAFIGEVEDLLQWLADYKLGLKTARPLGALPETAQKQHDKFMDDYNQLQVKDDQVKMILLNGEDMMARCKRADVIMLRESLGRLKHKWDDVSKRADRQKRRLDEHLENVNDFHTSLQIFMEWLANAEGIFGKFAYPSKLVEKVTRQIKEHKDFQDDLAAHREIMNLLDKNGTYLKYFGRKQDTVYLNNLLMTVRLRWKKLVRKSDERGRLLQQAAKEDKRFYDSWKELCDWLDDTERKLVNFSAQNKSPAEVKQFMEELKNHSIITNGCSGEWNPLQMERLYYEHQIGAKHPQYYTTTRLGRNLKDRCTKSDPDRDALQTMLDDLKNKWTVVRSLVSQRQSKLDEALLMSGRLSDAVQSLMDWLNRAEEALTQDQAVSGDMDTVNILIEQHKAFQQELDARQATITTLKEQLEEDPTIQGQLEQLDKKWEEVNHLSNTRESRLEDALKLAEEFQEVVHVMREWLPLAETELKFRALPEDELAIVDLIEQHEAFMEELTSKKQTVERIKELAEEILQNCHPNAVRFVRYYLTITWTRWEQALTRANNRSQRLQEALKNIRGTAALLEELLAWVTEAQALLAAKEKDAIPEDLTVVEALLKEHQEFHEDLQRKNNDVERVANMPVRAHNKKKDAKHGSPRVSEPEVMYHPRLTTLNNRWRAVWRMSVDRKKKLQDIYENLLELESFKNFDFDLWRQRYMNWIKAKKFRITDFFRRQDKSGDGTLTRQEFVDGMLISKFPTTRTELNAVFDIFDKDNSGAIDYREFIEALKPRSKARTKRPMTDAELVHDEIERQVSQCTCRQQFKADKLGEGKYKFGENKKVVLVRFLNSTVMVRVGGGWVTLEKFLENHDPCKAKGRTNTELREQFILPEGASQARATFGSRKSSGASTPSRESVDGGLSPAAPPTLKDSKKKSGSSSSLASSGSGRLSAAGMNGQATPSNGRATPSTPSNGRATPASSRSTPSSRHSTPSKTPGRTPTSAKKTPARKH